MSRYTFREKRCLVTGASSGLGRAVASALVAEGARVLATGRDEARLDRLRAEALGAGASAERLLVHRADLTDANERRALLDTARERFGSALDIVVQSAGVGAYGRLTSHAPEVMRQVFEINVFAAAELAREVHTLLGAGREAVMAVIGSVVARRGLPGRPEYSASKFAIAGLVEALRAEWSYDGIHVALINPGFTRTDFEENLIVDTAYLKSAQRRRQSPEQVARGVLRAIRGRKHEVVSASFKERLLLLVNRISPWVVDTGLARWTRALYRRHGVEPAGGGVRGR
jgi:short-subunit dehydrogenase